VLVFVADGMRYGSVNEHDTPALWTVRTKGVHFPNSRRRYLYAACFASGAASDCR
jgi:hypothetical protein